MWLCAIVHVQGKGPKDGTDSMPEFKFCQSKANVVVTE